MIHLTEPRDLSLKMSSHYPPRNKEIRSSEKTTEMFSEIYEELSTNYQN